MKNPSGRVTIVPRTRRCHVVDSQRNRACRMDAALVDATHSAALAGSDCGFRHWLAPSPYVREITLDSGGGNPGRRPAVLGPVSGHRSDRPAFLFSSCASGSDLLAPVRLDEAQRVVCGGCWRRHTAKGAHEGDHHEQTTSHSILRQSGLRRHGFPCQVRA